MGQTLRFAFWLFRAVANAMYQTPQMLCRATSLPLPGVLAQDWDFENLLDLRPGAGILLGFLTLLAQQAEVGINKLC